MQIVRHIAANGGWLPIDRYMDIALYDPEEGYYSESIQNIGARGDFSTSATLSPLLARTIVAHWRKTCKRIGKTIPLIEIGGGNGDLANAISRELGFWERIRTRYYIVDRSPTLRALQSLAVGNFARIYPSIEKALAKAGGIAFIFCNELADAFPARRFIFRHGEWMELGLSVQNGSITETPMPCPSLPESTTLDLWRIEGQRVEINEAYHTWLKQWIHNLQSWKAGTFVTIDYGDCVEELYYRKPQGTLRGYRAHQLLTGDELFRHSGKCDITCDVNFTDLRRIADSCLSDTVTAMSQRDYLLPQADRQNPADCYLVSEPGPGDHFHVIIQERPFE